MRIVIKLTTIAVAAFHGVSWCRSTILKKESNHERYRRINGNN